MPATLLKLACGAPWRERKPNTLNCSGWRLMHKSSLDWPLRRRAQATRPSSGPPSNARRMLL